MFRIFLSHSSIDELEAVALKEWLAQNGWDDVFVDLDLQRGLFVGKRWQEMLISIYTLYIPSSYRTATSEMAMSLE